LALGILLFARTAGAAPAGRDLVREAQIEAELQRLNPEIVESFRNARIAYDRDDFAAAETLYRAVRVVVPTFDPAIRRLGASLAAQGKKNEGLVACEQAIALKRSPDNLSTLAVVLAFPRKGESSAAESERALQLLRECRKPPRSDDVGTLNMIAQLALRLKRMMEFREVMNVLREKHSNQMATHYFAAIGHAVDEEWIRAEREIRIAGKMGLAPEAVQKFLSSGVQSRATGWRIGLYSVGVIGAWLAGLFLLFAIGFVLSKLVLRHAQAADPRIAVSPTEHRLRRIYRLVLNLAGVYYYLSLPIVALAVIDVTCAVFGAFLLIGWLPLKLLVVLAIVAVVTLWTMVKSLLLRVANEDPGRPLKREEAEGLWLLAEDVARDMGTRPIDEIRITPGTELAVYERGTWREKLQNKARRILILGTGVVNGFKQDDFRCVLAHEYGHFSNRDTAGGDIALRVQNDMMKFYLAMVSAGQATALNLAFHFLRVYHFIFRRISHGATRLQEILADRMAAQFYGAGALEGGLRQVIRRSIEFHALADREIKAGLAARRPLQNLYEAPFAEEGAGSQAAFDKALNRETSEDDTHPSPKDRFRLVASLKNPKRAARPGDVWELFRERESIAREMMSRLEEQVAPYRRHGDAA